jgi:hypothetical protein
LHCALDAENVLHVMADFVRQHVGLSEFAGRAKAPLELVIEAQIDVDLFVAGTVESAGCGLRAAAAGLGVVAEKNEFGVAILPPELVAVGTNMILLILAGELVREGDF